MEQIYCEQDLLKVGVKIPHYSAQEAYEAQLAEEAEWIEKQHEETERAEALYQMYLAETTNKEHTVEVV